MSAKKQLEKEIREAYVFLREKNNTIPSETLSFMLDASLEKLNGQLQEENKKLKEELINLERCSVDAQLSWEEEFKQLKQEKQELVEALECTNDFIPKCYEAITDANKELINKYK